MQSSKKVNLPPIPQNHQSSFSAINFPSEKEKKHSFSSTSTKKNLKLIENNNNINIINPNNESKENTKINEETKSYIEDLKKGSYNILVCVRCRPLSNLEYQLSNFETIKIMDKKILILMDPIEYNGPNKIFKNRKREQTYAFDFAFDKNTSQKEIFENSTKFLIEGVVNGYNATVFAYGATGAGKTYTMLGNENNPGIMPLTLKELFNKVNSFNDRNYKLKFWYLEIYNENIRDLLKFYNKYNNNLNDENEFLDLREDPIKGIIINNITEINIYNSNDMFKILKRGNRNRTQEATGANETSSRSHAILQISIEYKEKNSGIDFEIKYSKLSLIDLAGSERASQTQNKGIRLIEGGNINKSLLTLGNCINALCDANIKNIKKFYVPYRDSKLTRLLKDSLGGNSRTVMIANVSPSINTFDDTYNTLKYANRAKNIKTYVSRNVLNAQYHISNYVNIINSLKNEVCILKKQLQVYGNNNINVNNNLNNNNLINDNNVNKEYNSANQTQGTFSTVNFNNNIKMFNEEKFEESVNELKKACNCQVIVKQKIISAQNEINKLSDVIEMNKNIFSIKTNLNTIVQNNENIDENNLNKNDNLTIKKNSLEKNLAANQSRYKDFNKIIEKINKANLKKDFSDLQKEFLNLILKNCSYKIQAIDNQYNNLLQKAKDDIKTDYINELEKQIKYRDDLLKENKIEINKNLIKDLDTLKNDFKNKIPKYISVNNSTHFYANQNTFLGRNSFNKANNISNFNLNNNNNNNINIIQLNRLNAKFNNQNNLNYPVEKNNKNIKNNDNNNNKNYGSNFNNKKLKRSNKSYAYKNGTIWSSKNKKPPRMNSIKKKEIDLDIAYKKSKSFSDDDFINNHFGGINNEINGRLITIEQMPQVKKSDLNYLLNERDKRRQKLLDKINAGNKDML